MTTVSEQQWLDFIVRCLGSLVEKKGIAPTGAGLSSEVLKVAKAEGIEPPSTLARRKFSKILTELESAGRVVKLEVPGADWFIAPADQPTLLADGASAARQVKPGVRRDLFAALTIVSDKTPYYDRVNDCVVVVSHGEAPPAGTTPFPATSFQAHQERARRFADSQPSHLKDLLLAALATPANLSDFVRVINDHRLQPQWHEFRTHELTEILHNWSAENGIIFQSGWLTSAADGISSENRERGDGTELSDRQRRLAFEQLLISLGEEDVRRIAVPLDVVLKLIGGLRK